ncbi:MAG: hypothetical protein JWO67_5001 [Streptosporangiaceae bacterium]|jgi:hypothetical protein|nr:hypothetical protein [Streptosporangiaceae bacterium]
MDIRFRLLVVGIMALAMGAVLALVSLFILNYPGMAGGTALIAGGALFIRGRRYEGRRMAGHVVAALLIIALALSLLQFLPQRG